VSAGDVRDADVAVVGAGFSGLAAARAVVAGGASVVVLEARDRVGGRVDAARLAGGATVDLGGTWSGPGQHRIAALAREAGATAVEQHVDGDDLLDLDGRVRRFRGTVPRVGPGTVLDLARLQLGVRRAARRVSQQAPWSARDAARLDARSLDDWLRGRRHGRRARTLLAIAGRTIWGAEPRELSLLYVLQYVSGAGGLDALLDTEGGAQHQRYAEGAHAIAARIATGLGPRVVLGVAVEKIAPDGAGVLVRASGATVRARRAIVALPPPLCPAIDVGVPGAEAHRAAAGRWRMGALTKCFAVYAEPFWRTGGLSGEALSDAAPAGLTFDVSPPDASCGVLVGFVGGDDARAHARRGEAERRASVLRGFARLFGERALRPDGWVERAWAAERWSGGGPVAVAPPHAITAGGSALREPSGPVLWAGTERAERWGGYIEGAIIAGERAAALALERG
jgi:monoamine oxidase